MTMREYAACETLALLTRLEQQAGNVAELPDEESVHDLRVSIRRLNRCLRTFSQFYPGSSWKKLRVQLGDLMEAAAVVRDLDIAMALLTEHGLPRRSAAMSRLVRDRRKKGSELFERARHWTGSRVERWSRKLELPV